MNRFEDERGVIQDLFDGEPVNATWISTKKGAVRGNHFHALTYQMTFVLSGGLRMATGGVVRHVKPGERVTHPEGQAHAWEALEDSACLVLTYGPRGQDYESDTYRLDEPLL